MFRSLLALVALAGLASPVLAETRQCTTITSLPVTLSSSGTYCLASTLSTSIGSGTAINITTNNVTLDCNGHALVGTQSREATGVFGVFGEDRHNVTVRNCTIRGFYYGMWLKGWTGRGHLVENNLIAGNSLFGLNVEGDGIVVRDNRVIDTGGTDTSAVPVGIRAQGANAQVVRNQVSDVHTYFPQSAYDPQPSDVLGIAVWGAQPTVEANVVQYLEPYPYNGGVAHGIAVGWGDNLPLQGMIRGNTVLIAEHLGYPITVAYNAPADKSFCEGNTLLGFDPSYYGYKPLGGCAIDGGDNFAY